MSLGFGADIFSFDLGGEGQALGAAGLKAAFELPGLGSATGAREPPPRHWTPALASEAPRLSEGPKLPEEQVTSGRGFAETTALQTF